MSERRRDFLMWFFDHVCNILDCIPWWEDGHVVMSGFGCRLGILNWAFKKWGS